MIKNNTILSKDYQSTYSDIFRRRINLRLLRKTKKQTLMIFITFFIAYLTFPSIILYNKLPFKLNQSKDLQSRLYEGALIGLVNVGSCYLGSGLGVLVTNCCSLRMSNKTCVVALLLELVLTTVIIYGALFRGDDWHDALSLSAIMLLWFIHSLIASRF